MSIRTEVLVPFSLRHSTSHLRPKLKKLIVRVKTWRLPFYLTSVHLSICLPIGWVGTDCRLKTFFGWIKFRVEGAREVGDNLWGSKAFLRPTSLGDLFNG